MWGLQPKRVCKTLHKASHDLVCCTIALNLATDLARRLNCGPCEEEQTADCGSDSPRKVWGWGQRC